MQEMLSFGEWLSRHRKLLGLTQKQLADQVHCATITLRKIEAGQRRPSIQIVESLASVLTIPPAKHQVFIRFARDYSKVVAPGEIELFTNNRTGPAYYSSLPYHPTKFIGRERDISTVRKYLRDPDIRLVTLVGPPGIGKTRLSQEVAHGLLLDFQDGVYLIALAPLKTTGLLATAMLRSLGCEEISGQSPLEQLQDFIENKSMLLILDNLEHLTEIAGELVYDLLLACPNLKILATSREALKIAGEHIYCVPALDTPSEVQLRSLSVDNAPQYAAIRLFDDRAQAVNQRFTLNSENLKVVATICSRLDGLPLAIELFASRIKLISPQQLLTQLDGQFLLHTEGLRSLRYRQKTLYNSINWSYCLLTPIEKLMFTYLSSFSGGFTIPMVERVFSYGAFNYTVAGLVSSLFDKSLLQAMENVNGEPRFYMLNTIQQFAAMQRHDYSKWLTDHGQVHAYYH